MTIIFTIFYLGSLITMFAGFLHETIGLDTIVTDIFIEPIISVIRDQEQIELSENFFKIEPIVPVLTDQQTAELTSNIYFLYKKDFLLLADDILDKMYLNGFDINTMDMESIFIENFYNIVKNNAKYSHFNSNDYIILVLGKKVFLSIMEYPLK